MTPLGGRLYFFLPLRLERSVRCSASKSSQNSWTSRWLQHNFGGNALLFRVADPRKPARTRFGSRHRNVPHPTSLASCSNLRRGFVEPDRSARGPGGRWIRRQWSPRRGRHAVELAAVGVGLPADLCAAHAASVVVLVAIRQEQEECLPHRVCLLASGTEETRRLELSEAVYHVVILA